MEKRKKKVLEESKSNWDESDFNSYIKFFEDNLDRRLSRQDFGFMDYFEYEHLIADFTDAEKDDYANWTVYDMDEFGRP